jgi:hypothetical protein
MQVNNLALYMLHMPPGKKDGSNDCLHQKKMLANAAKATIHTVALSTNLGIENTSLDEEKPGCDSGTHPGLMASLPRHALSCLC